MAGDPRPQKANGPKRRAALYTRVSSTGQIDNYSLDYQTEQLRAYCRQNHIEAAGIYQDAGVSGSTLVDRPALRQLINDARAGKFTEVLIYRVDRFTRADPWDLYPLIKGLMDLDVRLTSTTESFDLTDDNGQLIFSILANFAARERRGIIQRTLGGKRAGARQGKYAGGRVPFGYTVDPDTGRFVPDDTVWWHGYGKAEVVRRIFAWYLELQSAAQVADILIRKGIPAPITVWNSAGLWQMLRNPVYKGDFVWGKRSHRLNQPGRTNDPEDWIVCPKAHPGLVSDEIWEQCAALLRKNRRGGRKSAAPRRLLDGLLACGRCGSTLTPRSVGKNSDLYRYTCASRYNQARRRDGIACRDAPFWPGEALANMVWGHTVDAIIATIVTAELVATITVQAFRGTTHLKQAAAAVRDAKAHLAQLQKQEERLLDLAVAGAFTAEVVARKQAQLGHEHRTAEAALAEARGLLAKLQKPAPGAAKKHTKCNTAAAPGLPDPHSRLIQTLRNHANTEDKRAVLTLVLEERIVVTDGGRVTIKMRPLGPSEIASKCP